MRPEIQKTSPSYIWPSPNAVSPQVGALHRLSPGEELRQPVEQWRLPVRCGRLRYGSDGEQGGGSHRGHWRLAVSPHKWWDRASRVFFLFGYHCVRSQVWLFPLVLLGMRTVRSSGTACWGRCVMPPAPPVCPCISTLQGCPNCREKHFLSFLTPPTTPPDTPLLPQRAASEAAHPLHSDFCVSSWSLTLIFLWTQMIFICTINSRFCCLFKDCTIPTVLKKKP